MLGQTIDQYKIVRALKKDAIAEIFLATHMQTGANYLLKAISRQLLTQEGFKDQFIEDAVNLIKFDHPNVIPLTNILDENGMLYTVEEYPGGRDLGRVIREHKGSFPLPGFKKLAGDILKGLGYAHGHRFVHRFISPKHIQITPDGQARVKGFGNVLPMVTEKVLDKEELVDVAAYFSPERFINPDTSDVRANIYSLGIIMFQMATGRLPFVGPSFDEFLEQHSHTALPNPKTYNPSLPETLVQAIATATSKRPEDRYQNTVECYKALIKVPETAQAPAAAPAPPTPPASVAVPVAHASLIDDSQFGFDQINEGDGQAVAGVDDSFDFGYEDVSGINEQIEASLANAYEDDTFSEEPGGGQEAPGDDAPSSAAFTLDDTAPDAEPVQSGSAQPVNDGGGFGFADEDQPVPPPGGPISGEVDAAVEGRLNFGGGQGEPGFDPGNDSLGGSFNFGDGGNDDSISFGALPQPNAPSNLDDTRSDTDSSFDFGAAPSTGGAEDSFDFGAATGAGEFDFDEPPSGSKVDASFDFGAPSSDPAGNDSFDFGAAAEQNDGLGFDTPGGGDLGAADFGFDSPSEDVDGYDDGGFDFEQPSTDAGSDSFDFGIANQQESFDSPESDPGDFDFGTAAPTLQSDVSASGLSFELGDTNPDSGSNEFNFDSPQASEVNNFLVDEGGDDPFGPPPPPSDDNADPFAAFAEEGEPPGDEASVPPVAKEPLTAAEPEPETLTPPPPPPPPPPPESVAREGLEASLAGIERDQHTAEKPVKPKSKVVRKFDKKVLALTLGLALLVVFAGFFWITSRKRSAEEAAFLDDIRNLTELKSYDEALSKIDTRLSGVPDSKFEQRLVQLKDVIEQGKAAVAKQIETLMTRARDYEAAGEDLTDGKTDALGSYMEVLSLDKGHKEARAAADRIKEDKVARSDALLGQGNDLAALKILSGLASADRRDRDIQEKYKGLRDRLNEARSGVLKDEIEKAYAAKKYSEIIPLMEELNEIDPNAKFYREMRKNVVDAFDTQAQNQSSRDNYVEAERAYKDALRLDPKNEKILTALAGLKDEKLNDDIARKLKELERVAKKGDFPKQYRLANQLMELDPGNQTAISALDNVEEEVSKLRFAAEEQRKKGQFRPAANLYKQIYDINGSEEVRALWAKFVKWSPPPGMSFIPVGPYTRGDHNTLNARPASRIQVSNFFLDQREVTNAEFHKFVEARPQWHPRQINNKYHDGNYLQHWENGKPTAQDLNLPVTHVSWYAAEAYAAYKGKRLPTEAEWEKAAAGNSYGQKYWWGNYSDAKKAVYEFYPEKRPAPVGSFPANSYDIHEILGNVNEWVQDTYDPRYYQRTKEARDPVNLDPGPEKVFRGGSFKSRGRDLALFLRFYSDPRLCHATIGFRCAQDARGEEE